MIFRSMHVCLAHTHTHPDTSVCVRVRVCARDNTQTHYQPVHEHANIDSTQFDQREKKPPDNTTSATNNIKPQLSVWYVSVCVCVIAGDPAPPHAT